jgi:hypothetical protein
VREGARRPWIAIFELSRLGSVPHRMRIQSRSWRMSATVV